MSKIIMLPGLVSSWLVDGFLLALSSGSLSSVCAEREAMCLVTLPLLIRTLVLSD